MKSYTTVKVLNTYEYKRHRPAPNAYAATPGGEQDSSW